MNTKEVLLALDFITRCGDLRDYNDEIANRIEDAKSIVQSHDKLLAAAKSGLKALSDFDASDLDMGEELVGSMQNGMAELIDAIPNAKKLP